MKDNKMITAICEIKSLRKQAKGKAVISVDITTAKK